MIYKYENCISREQLREALKKSLEGRELKKVLILPSDFTRMYSGAGKLTEEEVRGAAFNYVPYEKMAAKYDPAKLVDGFNTVDGEEIFYISNPALGLWVCDNR